MNIKNKTKKYMLVLVMLTTCFTFINTVSFASPPPPGWYAEDGKRTGDEVKQYLKKCEQTNKEIATVTVSTVKGATSGAIYGAVGGAVSGGASGAIKGAISGAVVGATKGMVEGIKQVKEQT